MFPTVNQSAEAQADEADGLIVVVRFRCVSGTYRAVSHHAQHTVLGSEAY